MARPARLIFLTAILILSLALAGCKSTPLAAEWYAAAFDINGQPDLGEFKGLRIPDVQARFVIANDDERLLLSIQTTDEALRRQVHIGGVTLWLTNPQDRRETFGVRYPALPQRGVRPREQIGPHDIGSDAPPFMQDQQPQALAILDADGRGERVMSADSARALGLDAVTRHEARTVAHVIAITLDSLAPWLKAGDEVLLSLEIPKIEEPTRVPDDGERRGRPTGAMGGMGNGGNRGGHPGGPPGSTAPHAETGKAIRITQMLALARGPLAEK